MNKGLSNFQIDDFFKNEENEDFKKNIRLQYLALTKKMNLVFTGGVL